MMDLVIQIEQILGRSDESGVLEMLVSNISDALKLRCGSDTVPEQLRFIVIEATLSRYNKLGAEGLKSESIDIVSQTFIDDVLTPYDKYIEAYNRSSGVNTNGKVTFV